MSILNSAALCVWLEPWTLCGLCSILLTCWPSDSFFFATDSAQNATSALYCNVCKNKFLLKLIGPSFQIKFQKTQNNRINQTQLPCCSGLGARNVLHSSGLTPHWGSPCNLALASLHDTLKNNYSYVGHRFQMLKVIGDLCFRSTSVAQLVGVQFPQSNRTKQHLLQHQC